MEKGYVYIARIVDHGGKFVNGYHKIGKSIQYKVRETQLNSTHLPFDVLFVTSKVVFKINGEDLSQSTAKDTFVLAMTKIAEVVGWEVLDVKEPHIATSIDELGFEYEETKMINCSVYVGNYVVWTNTSNQEKVRRVNNHIKYFGLDGFEFYVEK